MYGNSELILFPIWECTLRNKKTNKKRELILDSVFGNEIKIVKLFHNTYCLGKKIHMWKIHNLLIPIAFSIKLYYHCG